MKISLAPFVFSKWLFAVLIILTAAGLSASFAYYHWNIPGTLAFCDLWNMDREQSIPTWYEIAVLFISVFLLMLITVDKFRTSDRWRIHWGLLSAGFILMSIDEQAAIHEKTIKPLRETFELTGVFYYAWVIPGVMIVVAAAFIFFRFMMDLSARTRALFFWAGFVYVCGALGMEFVEGYYASRHGQDNFSFMILAHIEEFLEIGSLILFNYALMTYLRDERRQGALEIELKK